MDLDQILDVGPLLALVVAVGVLVWIVLDSRRQGYAATAYLTVAVAAVVIALFGLAFVVMPDLLGEQATTTTRFMRSLGAIAGIVALFTGGLYALRIGLPATAAGRACPRCGKATEASWDRCPYCQAVLVGSATNGPRSDPEPAAGRSAEAANQPAMPPKAADPFDPTRPAMVATGEPRSPDSAGSAARRPAPDAAPLADPGPGPSAAGMPGSQATRNLGAADPPTVRFEAARALQLAWLVFLDGPLAGATVPLGDDALIGRSGERCRIVLVDEAVSSLHARIRWQDDAFVLTDVGSTNGSFVNGEELRASRALKDGDRITFGTTRLAFMQVLSSRSRTEA